MHSEAPHFDYPKAVFNAASAVMLVTLMLAVWGAASGRLDPVPRDAQPFLFIWLVLAVVASLSLRRLGIQVAFLTSLLCMLVAWRIAGLHGAGLVAYPLILAFGLYLIVFFAIAIRNRRLAEGAGRLSLGVWQLTFIRCYIGFDLVPHFTEKLFAGSGPRGEDVVAFTKLGVPIPEFFVILAGFCELGVAIGIGLGVLTRLAACGSALYFLIATILGHHFFLGFIWASPGGGWEYPVLMIALLLSFTVAGGGPFSIDAAVAGKLELPGWCLWLMGRR